MPTQGLATVLAPATGVLSQLDVVEGGEVKPGQTLAVVTVPRATVGEGDTTRAMEARLARRAQGLRDSHSAQTQLLDAQAGGLSVQLANARRELVQLESEIATRRGQVRIAEETLKRLRQLQGERFVSELQVKQQEAAHLQTLSDMQVLQRQATNARRGIAQLQQALREMPGQRLASDASFERDLASLEQEQVEIQARGALTVNAPVAGMIATQLVKSGQAVQVGQPILTVLPKDARLEAELLVPSRAIGFVEPGDTVLLRFQAYPYQKFGHQEGHVSRISRSALSASELNILLGNSVKNEPLYRVTVRLAKQKIIVYGTTESLRPGLTLEADTIGDRRRLIEWIFEPLYSLKEKMGDS